MKVLDTNVVLELMRLRPEPAVLAFDLSAASVYAQMVADRECSGYGMAMADAQIAATCVAHGATLVTRNQRHFEGWGLPLIDPWQGAAATGR